MVIHPILNAVAAADRLYAEVLESMGILRGLTGATSWNSIALTFVAKICFRYVKFELLFLAKPFLGMGILF